MRLFIAVLCLVVVMPYAHAQQTPVMFQKQRLIIHPQTLVSPEFNQGILLEIEVKDTATNQQEDWLQLKGYAPGTGLLEVYPPNTAIHITQKPIMAAVDVIVIDHEGNVVMIAPELVLKSLPLPIERSGTMRAILYAEAGFAETVGLAVGDDVEHKLFQKPPAVIDETSQPQTEAEASEVDSVDETETSSSQPKEEARTNSKEKQTSDTPKRRRPIANPIKTEPVAQPNTVITDEPDPKLMDALIERHQRAPETY